MSEERDDDPKEVTATGVPPADRPAGPERAAQGGPEASPIDELRTKVTQAANDFLKSRLGLEEGVDGSLRFPDRGAFENIGQRADQFVRGFFRGFVEKTPEEREVMAGLRDPKDVPSGTEVAARLLAKVSQTMSGAFHEYLKENAVDPARPDAPVVVDGRFVMRHGAPLLATFVQALGTGFADQRGAEIVSEDEVLDGAAQSSQKAEVDYRVDLPAVFKSLFVRPQGDEGDER